MNACMIVNIKAQNVLMEHCVNIKRANRMITGLCHISFAGDSMLFCNAHLSWCKHLENIYHLYDKASGKKVNFDKSTVCWECK